MEGQVIAALVLAIPIIMLPGIFVWYLNAGGLFHAVKVRKAGLAPEKGTASNQRLCPNA